MIPKKGIVLIGRKDPVCSACDALKKKLRVLGLKYTELDALQDRDKYEELQFIRSVPQLYVNGKLFDDHRMESLKRILK